LPDKRFTDGTARAGAIGKSIGSVAASWKATTLAKGLRFSLWATSLVVKISAAAPSFRVDAFPAVTVPFSFYICKKKKIYFQEIYKLLIYYLLN